MRIFTIIAAAICILPANGHAGDNAPDVIRGREIVKAVRQKNTGFSSLSASINMTMVNRRGQPHLRTMRIHIREREGGARYSICHVETPPDVRGTILLSHSLPDTDSQQWLYLPSLHRTRRIAAQARSGAFMGSEFSYEDLIGQPLDHGNHRWIRDEDLGERQCHVLEWIPLDPLNSGYYRQVAWVDSADFLVRRIDYYNRRQEKQKTLTLEQLSPIQRPFLVCKNDGYA
jgi:outer membrane lipoprotein-sorting protein